MFIVAPSGNTKPAVDGRDAESLASDRQCSRQRCAARAGRECRHEHVLDLPEELHWATLGEQHEPERHRPEQVQEQHAGAAKHEQPKRNEDVESHLHDDAENHCRNRVRREPQGEVHDPGHQVGNGFQSVEKLPLARFRQGQTGRAHQDGKEDQRQDLAEHVALVADERAEQVARHEHVDYRGWCHRRARLMGGDVRLRLPAVFLHQRGGRRRIQLPTRVQHVHHQQPERDPDEHVRREQRERLACERAEVGEFTELHDAARQRGENQGDHHEEQHAQEDLPERIEQVRGDPLRAFQQAWDEVSQQQHQRAGDSAYREPDQDTVG
jgi:hypothetical protein